MLEAYYVTQNKSQAGKRRYLAREIRVPIKVDSSGSPEQRLLIHLNQLSLKSLKQLLTEESIYSLRLYFLQTIKG